MSLEWADELGCIRRKDSRRESNASEPGDEDNSFSRKRFTIWRFVQTSTTSTLQTALTLAK